MRIKPSRVMGHRGVPSLAPENTLGGFAKAAAVGARWVELDVTLLQDHTPVVHHDATLERCSDHGGKLSALLPADLEGVNNAALYPDWPAEPVPLLTDVLDLLKAQGTGLNLEIKSHSFDPKLTAQVVIDTLKGRFPEERLMISSFELPVLAEVARCAPQIALGLICDELPDDWLAQARKLNLFSIHCNWRYLSQHCIAEIKQQGLQLYCWTANDPQQIASLWHWGIDGVITDNPQDFITDNETQ